MQKHQDVCDSLQAFSTADEMKKVALEVLAFTTPPAKLDELREMFFKMDEDDSGTISFAEFEKAMSKHPEISMTQLKQIFHDMDVSRSARSSTTSSSPPRCRREEARQAVDQDGVPDARPRRQRLRRRQRPEGDPRQGQGVHREGARRDRRAHRVRQGRQALLRRLHEADGQGREAGPGARPLRMTRLARRPRLRLALRVGQVGARRRHGPTEPTALDPTVPDRHQRPLPSNPSRIPRAHAHIQTFGARCIRVCW